MWGWLFAAACGFVLVLFGARFAKYGSEWSYWIDILLYSPSAILLGAASVLGAIAWKIHCTYAAATVFAIIGNALTFTLLLVLFAEIIAATQGGEFLGIAYPAKPYSQFQSLFGMIIIGPISFFLTIGISFPFGLVLSIALIIRYCNICPLRWKMYTAFFIGAVISWLLTILAGVILGNA